MTSKKVLGARIQDLRLENHLSLADLARSSGVSKGHISNIEHGLVALTIVTAARLARGLGVETLDLVVFPEKNTRHQLIEKTRHMSSNELERLLELLKKVAGRVSVRKTT